MYATILRLVLKNKIFAVQLAANILFLVAEQTTDKYSPNKCYGGNWRAVQFIHQLLPSLLNLI